MILLKLNGLVVWLSGFFLSFEDVWITCSILNVKKDVEKFKEFILFMMMSWVLLMLEEVIDDDEQLMVRSNSSKFCSFSENVSISMFWV